MSRLLKSVYFKATSHPKFYSYSTKTNSYGEVLKTLRSWEQDRRNRSQTFSRHKDQQRALNNEYLSSSTSENKNLNVHNEDLHLSEDINIVSTRTDDVYIYTSSNHKIFNSENSEVFIEGQELENKSKIIFPMKDDMGLQSVEISSSNFKTVNKDNLNKLEGASHPRSDTETVKHIRDFGERTNKKNKILSDSELPKMKKKKLKRMKAKSSLPDSEVRTNVENLNNLLPHKNLNKFSADLTVRDDTKSISSSSLRRKNSSKNGGIEQQKSNEEKTAEPLNKFLNLTGKEGNTTDSSKNVANIFSVKESGTAHNSSSSLNVKSLNFPLKSEEKTANEIACDKTLVKAKGKTKGKKAEAKVNAMKEEQKQKAKLENAILSLRSLMEAYINANEIAKAHRTFEYLLHDEKKKKFVDVDLFNVIISGWSRQGKLEKVKHLFLLMADENIIPNLQSYVYYLEAASRDSKLEISEISKILNEMKLHKFSPKDLLQNCVFVGDQRKKIIQSMGFVERDLSLPLYVPGEAYSYSLLKKLNDKNYEKGDSHFNFCFDAKDIQELAAKQMEIEEKTVIKVKSVNVVTKVDDKTLKAREYIKECEAEWRKKLTKSINSLKSPKRQQQGILSVSPNQSIYPYLAIIDTEILVNLLLQEARMLGETAEFYSPNIRVLYKDIGLKVMRHYFMAINKKNEVTSKVHSVYEEYLNHLLDPDLCAKYSPREYWEFLKSKHAEDATIDVSNSNWPYSLLIFIGSIMYNTLRSNIGFNPNRVTSRKSDTNFMYPAFHIIYEREENMKLSRQIRAHDMFTKLYRDAKLEHIDFDVALIPMLSPPRPWVKYDCGGMVITKIPFIRFPEHARALNSYYSKVPLHQLSPCFDSLNNLSLCPWIINKPVLDIIIKIFQDGGNDELDIPLNPANYHLDPELVESAENEKSGYKHKMMYEKKKCEMTSLWFDCLYKLSIANHFRDKVFWFPHNLDFRGRVYPIPPHFNHLGNDLSRSILLFAAGKPLGEKGLDWLKIHLINLTAFKKRASHAERLEYANEMLPEILDSADNPFNGNKWWMKSDKPLQTLACCKELAAAVRHPNPAEYISHYPIHQDGSCNGLQHYAALGRDELGAIEVNLHPGSAPQDVYTAVAALVEKERDRDAAIGLEVAQALDGFVTRKVVKQTVMTFVYGVTAFGAKQQVLKQLKDMPELPEKYHHAAATYVTKKIFFSIKEMFTATRKIQEWFTVCADKITRVTDEAVEWTTPLGLPVIQPYYKELKVKDSKFCLPKGCHENITYYISQYETYQRPTIRKQKNAFAPNFIHSLDSTHMMLTSLFCHRKGLTFVSVHDCFWTHASTVEAMNKVCREQFVALHSEPILENLASFFQERYIEKNPCLKIKRAKSIAKMQNVLNEVPGKGTFDLKQVLNSEYFFS